ncbi:MAG: helix-turn-helix transcriptional regulator [Candidatus Eremiobacteraeota bacterium]|nr:helix-turn-helix transcriptional regulator [Candidatus Eremiobacteraeota bacterium]MCW5866030.1 helix-turn-helix transcriptional regulator [Candidatus Eremiobacteraeota bacterium]
MKGVNKGNDYVRGLLWCRRQKGLSQSGVADTSGVSQKQISCYENCKVKPHPATVKKLADALDCTIHDLYILHEEE